jgi:hydroxyacylglutathione hydrolase
MARTERVQGVLRRTKRLKRFLFFQGPTARVMTIRAALARTTRTYIAPTLRHGAADRPALLIRPRAMASNSSTSTSTTQSGNAAPSRTHGGLTVLRVPVLNDNYSWLVHDEQTGATAVVDPAEVDPIVKTLAAQNWTLTHVLNTHHHWDHTGGNLELKERFNATVVGPKADRERIPGIDVALADGDEYSVGSSRLVCFDTPGHTKGHITLYFPDNRALFPGDTLFSMGCGRLFEGSPAQMWDSLQKLVVLPKDTLVYCAHEYTLSNAKFALHVEPGNQALARRAEEVRLAREQGVPTVRIDLGTGSATRSFVHSVIQSFSQSVSHSFACSHARSCVGAV